MNSPSLSVDDEHTLKVGYNDQCYQYDSFGPFQPLPPPPIHGAPLPFRGQSQPNLANTSPTQGHLAPQPDTMNDYSMQNSLHYSIFSNQLAMNLAGSLGGQSQLGLMLYNLDEQLLTELVNEFSAPNDFYQLNDLDITGLLDLLPLQPPPPQAMLSFQGNQLVGSHFSHPLLVSHAGADFMGSAPSEMTSAGEFPPFTPTLNEFELIGTPHAQAPPQGTFTHQQPLMPPRAGHTTPPSQRISKKQLNPRLNAVSNKKNLMISTLTPMSTELSPGFGVSPLCNKYRNLDIHAQPPQPRLVSNVSLAALSYENQQPFFHHQPQQMGTMAPPANVFRHGLELSTLLTGGLFYEPLHQLYPPSQSTPGAMTPPLTLTPPRRKYSSLLEVSAQKVKNLSRKQQESVGMLMPLSLPPLIPVPPPPVAQNPAPVATPISMTPTAPPPLMMHGNNSLSLVLLSGSVSLDLGQAVNLAIASGQKPKKHTRRRLLPRLKNGCWICRIKHLKCDEARPVCSLCLKFGIDCDYLADKPDYVTDKNIRKEKLLSISILRKQKQETTKGRKKKSLTLPSLKYETGDSPDMFEQSLVNYDL